MPISIDAHISLETTTPLDKGAMQAWYRCVKAKAPSGLIRTAQTTDQSGGLRPVALLVRQEAGKTTYTVPLTRNLTETEAEDILTAYEPPNGLEYDVSISSSYQELVPDAAEISLDADKYTDLCTAWAKRQHDNWMSDRIAGGWRYGPTVSVSQKTHPMIKAWSDLPAEQRGVDLDAPTKMVALLNDQGYAVIRQSELDAIKTLLRASSH